MAVTDKPWNGSASKYATTKEYCDACIINTNDGDPKDWVEAKCKLPVKEPNGDINSNGVHAAAAALAGARGGIKESSEIKKAAAKKLASIYRQIKQDVPESIKNMAG